jgi:hypothetical protein
MRSAMGVALAVDAVTAILKRAFQMVDRLTTQVSTAAPERTGASPMLVRMEGSRRAAAGVRRAQRVQKAGGLY